MKMEATPNSSQPHPLEAPTPWNEKDVSTARQFFAALDGVAGVTFNEKKNIAANKIGYKDGYVSMPQGVKSYISHVAAEAKKRKKRENEALTPVYDLEAEWLELFDTDPAFRHAMTHPEDE